MRLAITLAALAALGLAGCTFDPAYQRPAPPVPAAWPQGPSYAAPVAGPAAETLAWRSFFRDPKLQDVIAQALANNRDLRVAVGNIEAARASFQVQRAELLPNVSASAGYTKERLPAAQTGLGFGYSTGIYSASLGLSAWEIDLFGRLRSLTRAAQEQYLASEEARRAVQTSLISQVASDWLALAADRDLLRIAQDTLKSQQASLDLTQARFDHGEASMVEVSQAQTTVQQARADVAQFTTQTAQDKNALDLVVGATVAESQLPDGLPPTAAMLTELPAGTSSVVLLQRPDVLQAEHQLKASNAQIGAARSAFFPTISLTGAAGLASPALGQLFSGASHSWSYSPTATLPIFAGGANVANLRGARAQHDIAVAQYEKAIQTAFSEVADALARRGTIAEQIDAERQNEAAASTAFQLENARYVRGSETYLNVLIAQRALYNARQALVSAQLVELTNAVSLYRALGGGVS